MLWSTTARANEHRPLDLHVAELSKAGDPAWAVRPGAGVSGAYPPWSMGPPLAAAPRRRRPACAAVSTGGQGRVSARAPAAARRRAPPPGAAPRGAGAGAGAGGACGRRGRRARRRADAEGLEGWRERVGRLRARGLAPGPMRTLHASLCPASTPHTPRAPSCANSGHCSRVANGSSKQAPTRCKTQSCGHLWLEIEEARQGHSRRQDACGARIPQRLRRCPAGRGRGRCRPRACPGQPQTSMTRPARAAT